METISYMDLLLALALMVGATLYSSVGHAGASAYIAIMALFNMPTALMRPTALSLNIIVASLNSLRYIRAGLFRLRTLWPFAVTAIPCAFIGGMIELPPTIYRPIIGVILWLSAARLFFPAPLSAEIASKDPPLLLALVVGCGLGLLAGLTGTGGGIFLSPLLLFMQWSPIKRASGVVSLFILFNSIAGLLGNYSSLNNLPPHLWLYAGAVLLGSLIGSTLGIRLDSGRVTKLLGFVLLIAGAKMFGVY